MPTSSLVDRALAYASNAVPIFALSEKSKFPRSHSHGHKDATCDRETILKWWGKSPNSNIGHPTGRFTRFESEEIIDTGRFVIESDPRNGGSFEKFEAQFGKLPDTYTNQSPGTGFHKYFKRPYDLDYVKTQTNLFPGIDVKGDGGYVLLPPSVIYKNGKLVGEYKVVNDIAIADPPAWLVLLLQKDYGKGKGSKKRVILKPDEFIEEGGRNAAVFGEACYYRWLGMDAQSIRIAIDDYNRIYCNPPLEPSEIETIVGSASKYAPGTGRTKSEIRDALLREEVEKLDIFRDQNGQAMVALPIDGHIEYVAAKSGRFKRYLFDYFLSLDEPLTLNVDQLARQVLSAECIADKKETRETFIRIGHAPGKVYFDLGDSTHRVVEVTKDAWSILPTSPVVFRRDDAMKPIPEPVRGGRIEEIYPVVNIQTPEARVMFISWLLSTFQPTGPLPILQISGEQGAAKTFTATCLRRLIDDSVIPGCAQLPDERQLSIAMKNQCIGFFDNLSGVSAEMSDAYCRLISGMGLRTRKLHTDDEEMIFRGRRSLILGGIDDIATRPDLLDRCVLVHLRRIPDGDRKPESELEAVFENVRGRVLGFLLDCVSHGLFLLATTPNCDVRMADYARWISACEGALVGVDLGDGLEWTPGTFMNTYMENRQDAINENIDNDSFGAAFLAEALKMTEKGVGVSDLTSQQVLDLFPRPVDLSEDPRTSGYSRWPRSPVWLSRRLRRLAPGLRESGIAVTLDLKKNGAKYIRIERAVVDKQEKLKLMPAPKPVDEYDPLNPSDEMIAEFEAYLERQVA